MENLQKMNTEKHSPLMIYIEGKDYEIMWLMIMY